MDLAIIISVHNRNDLRLKNCLRTLLQQNTVYDYGIYIVDYASTDNLPSMLGVLGSNKTYYFHIDSEPLNRAHANNIALKMVDADLVCMTDGYCLFQDTLVETFCTKATEDSLMVRIRRPSYIPDYLWQDENLTPEDFEAFRQQGAEWLEEVLHVAPGVKRRRLFAVKRERLLEIRGYDERLAYDEDVDIVRRLLQSGNALVDASDDIAMAYQPSVEDREVKSILGQQQQHDLELHENFSAYIRKTTERNLNREWGVV